MNKLLKHLKTIRTHRKYVRQMCFKVGLYWQGLTHDLSKYSIEELKMCKYWTGKRSPHQECREILGYSPSWIHHYHINKHHFQYWWDETEDGKIVPIKMPFKYLLESFCDMVGASKAYCPDTWQPQMLLDYWNNKCKGKRIMNTVSEDMIERWIKDLVLMGEDTFIEYLNRNKKSIKMLYDSKGD